jgi:hypothetical protein
MHTQDQCKGNSSLQHSCSLAWSYVFEANADTVRLKRSTSEAVYSYRTFCSSYTHFSITVVSIAVMIVLPLALTRQSACIVAIGSTGHEYYVLVLTSSSSVLH